jgi:4-amino-4-deoxy-L-arabinose transferase-like glycosyltransferase
MLGVRGSTWRDKWRASPAGRWLARASSRRWSPHLALFGLALALRGAWVLAVVRKGMAFNDSIVYHTTALSLRSGHGYTPFTGGPTARWPPGYSTLLGGLYWSIEAKPIVGELANAVIGAVTVVLLMLAVERAVDRTTAIVAGTILAVLPGPILWTDVIVSETLYTALFVAMLLVCVRARPTWRWTLAIGVVIGMAALVRGEALTWALLPVVLWWREIPRRQLAKRFGAIVATVIVLLAPWTIRNAVVMDAFVPIATNASQTMWSGHHAGATGGQTYPSAEFGKRYDGLGVAQRELQSSRDLRNEAIEYMATHPVRELELIPLKLIHLNRGDSYALDWVNDPSGDQVPPLSQIAVERIGVIADAGYFGLLALTLLGIVLLGRRFWSLPIGRVIATSFVTMLFLYGFLYYGNYRYRLPYEPMMVVVAASLLVRMWRVRDRPVNTTGTATTSA